MTSRPPRLTLCLAAVSVLGAVLVPSVARSDGGRSQSDPVGAAQGLGMSCSPVTSGDGVAYTKCAGKLPTFDGIGLDTDLSIPAGANAPSPTILMMHGWSNDMTEWESDTKSGDGADTYHWNNVWFVSRGWVVVNPTARGFMQSCGQFDPDPKCATGWTHLADRSWETRDSQFLLGTLVNAGIADPTKLAATGGSYGGGQSWLLATSLPWTSPGGRTLQLSAAVPKYPWTDLLYSLLPNGRESSGPDQSRSHWRPLGVEQSYVAGLYATGRAKGQGRYNSSDPSDLGSALDMEYVLISAGEPYDTNPLVPQIAAAFENKSSYYARAYFDQVSSRSIHEVPVLSIQGFTDPLFPVTETLQMFRRLKAADPAYPVWMVFGDIGHSNAQNPQGQWQPINDLATRFLDVAVLRRPGALPPQASAFVTHCPGPYEAARPITGVWDRLAPGSATATAGGAMSTSSADPNPADGAATDPIAHMDTCLTESPDVVDPGAVYRSWLVPAGGFTLLGLPDLSFGYSLHGEDATLAFKLWDVAPDGSKTLATRGVYRLAVAGGDPSQGTIHVQLFGNAWFFSPGHEVRLQISQADPPYLRPDNLASTLDLSSLRLVLPTREPGSRVLVPAPG